MGIVLAIKNVNIVEKPKGKVLQLVDKHYPQRDSRALSITKIAEHQAVIKCINELLRHERWWIEHENSGSPVIFVEGIPSHWSISISHAVDNTGKHHHIAYAAVILRKGESRINDPIGVDIVVKGDVRLDRIASRVMGKEELEDGRFEEIWACKEAMFKALGPGLDFVKDLKVDFISEDLLTGMGRKWAVKHEDKVVVVFGPV